MKKFAFALVASAGILGAFAFSSKVTPPGFTARGTLMQGRECLVLQTCDLTNSYSLTGNLGGFAAGQQVEVRGKRVDAAFCNSPGGPGINVQQITAYVCQ